MKGSFNQDKGFGVEIEFLIPRDKQRQDIAEAILGAFIANDIDQTCYVEGYNHITRPHWKMVSDSSVTSTQTHIGDNELVSPILRGESGKKQLSLVLSVLREQGCTINQSCGIHVHHDITEQMVSSSKTSRVFLNNLIKLVMKYEHFIYRLVTPSRLSRGWCRPTRKVFSRVFGRQNSKAQLKRIAKAIFKKVDSDVKLKNERIGSGLGNYYPRMQTTRYCGLNLRNAWTRGSVEFRYMQGSLNFSKIWAWTVFTQAIVNTAIENKSVAFTDTGVTMKHFRRFKKAIGFLCGTRCEEVKFANKVINKRFAELKHLERAEAENWRFVRTGLEGWS